MGKIGMTSFINGLLVYSHSIYPLFKLKYNVIETDEDVCNVKRKQGNSRILDTLEHAKLKICRKYILFLVQLNCLN